MTHFKITPELKKTFPRKLVVIFVLFTIGILIIGITYYKYQRTRIFKENQNELSAISSLKTGQIEQWHSERLSTAETIKENDPLLKSIKQYFIDENQPEIRRELMKWMESLIKEYDYNGVSFIDTNLKTRLSASTPDSIYTGNIQKELSEVLKKHSVFMTDLHKTDKTEKVYIDLLIPLTEPGSKDLKPFGIIILRLDPGKILFPLIQSWPTPSKSSETLLLRLEGDSILYLNELRHRKNTALKLKMPVTDERLLASKAVKGVEGVVEGVDYRQVQVYGYLTRIRGLPWFMVAKIDTEELLVPLKRQFNIAVIGTILLILVNALFFGFWIWDQRLILYKQQLQNELDKKQSEAEIRLQNEIMSHMAEAVYLVRMEDGVIVFANSRFESMFGYIESEMIGKHVSIVNAPTEKSPEETAKEIMSSLAVKGFWTGEVLNIRKNGTIFWTSANVSIFDHSQFGKVLVSVQKDITESKNAETKIRKLNENLEERVIQRTEQLEAANKELEAFSYSVSHDLRAPLRSIHGFTKILLEDYETSLDEEGKRVCGIISSSATQMGKLIDDLLSFSRIGRSTLNPSLIDMSKLVRKLFEGMISPYEKEKIKLKVGKLNKAFGDVTLLGQVWVNLLSNAIKYSSKNANSEISIGSLVSGEMITYYIKDNGVGFDQQYLHKLFGVFQRLHSENEFEGNGVGLAIVQRIVLRHGGKVWAEGEVGKGATFYFSLPAYSERQNKDNTAVN